MQRDGDKKAQRVQNKTNKGSSKLPKITQNKVSVLYSIYCMSLQNIVHFSEMTLTGNSYNWIDFLTYLIDKIIVSSGTALMQTSTAFNRTLF